MLNYYYYLQNLMDYQVGRIFAAIPPSVLQNTVIIFTSDHGEYCMSHGLRTKGGAVYEEGIRIPFYVRLPGQATPQTRSQIASSVDLFGLMCDFATVATPLGTGAWRTQYPDLAGRESLYNFIYAPTTTRSVRTVTVNGTQQPYILTTTDETECGDPTSKVPRSHVAAVRIQRNMSVGQPGAKYARYADWTPGTINPGGAVDEEFYDYGNTPANTRELGNDINTADTVSAHIRDDLRTALCGPVMTGELRRPLVGQGLQAAQTTAIQRYLQYRGEI
jgi:hypothetical protein